VKTEFENINGLKMQLRSQWARLIGRDEIGDVLHLGSIAPIFKRVAQWIGMPARFVAEVSGRSTRVGAAQDLAELDIDLAAITQAGGEVTTDAAAVCREDQCDTVRNGKGRREVREGFLAVRGVAYRLITLGASALIDVMVVGADSAGPITPIIAIVTNCPEKHCTAAKSTLQSERNLSARAETTRGIKRGAAQQQHSRQSADLDHSKSRMLLIRRRNE
jgi:hypothetical protein